MDRSTAPAAETAQGPRLLYQWHWYVAKLVPSGNEIGIKAHQNDAFKELHRCFNCSFPVAGAPHAFPTNGQYIPLRACFTFFCKPAPVRSYLGNG